MVIGGVIGAVNGLLVTKFHINSFVGTLGVGTLVVGLDYAYSGGRPIVALDQNAFLKITTTKMLGIPAPVWITILVAIILWVFLNRTVFGLSTQATGGNRMVFSLPSSFAFRASSIASTILI